jgi:hypothetical protein
MAISRQRRQVSIYGAVLDRSLRFNFLVWRKDIVLSIMVVNYFSLSFVGEEIWN